MSLPPMQKHNELMQMNFPSAWGPVCHGRLPDSTPQSQIWIMHWHFTPTSLYLSFCCVCTDRIDLHIIHCDVHNGWRLAIFAQWEKKNMNKYTFGITWLVIGPRVSNGAWNAIRKLFLFYQNIPYLGSNSEVGTRGLMQTVYLHMV